MSTDAVEEKPTTHLTEELPDGTKREWMMSGQPYTGTPKQRAAVLKAVEDMDWQRPNRRMAMSPALLIQEVIQVMRLKLVAEIGYSIWGIEHPDCACPDPTHPDHWATYSLIGIRVRFRRDWWTLYYLDIGSGAVWLISDTTPDPVQADVSVACAMNWHNQCKGTFKIKGSEDRSACMCTCFHYLTKTEEAPS